MEEPCKVSNTLSAGQQFRKEAYEWAEFTAVSLAIVLFVFTFLIRIYMVEGPSMENTLQQGERLITTNLFYTPHKGDIVVASRERDTPIVKRVIATAGQTVDINFITGEVCVDGELLQEDYIKNPTTLYYDISFPQTVPEGCVFLMGDNRQHSLDSRDSSIGMVHLEQIKGKVLWGFNLPFLSQTLA